MFSKFIKDLKTYVYGTDVFSFVDQKEGFLYPIDFVFTLDDQSFYFYPFDGRGIPYTKASQGRSLYSPSKIGAYAFAQHSNFVLNADLDAREKFLACADWFLSNEEALYYFEFDWMDSDAPWISALAQGQACSVLLRAYKITNDKKFLLHARMALAPFFVSIEKGGVQSRLGDDSVFLEEYPSTEPSHVLNGFMFALIGLTEFVNETKSQEHESLLISLSSSLCTNIKSWSSNKWSLYEDPVICNGNNYSTPSYHNLHITQLKWFCLNNDSNEVRAVLNLWEQSRNSLFNRLFGLLGKIYFRLKKC